MLMIPAHQEHFLGNWRHFGQHPHGPRDFDVDQGQKMAHRLPQSITELTATSTAKNWKQPELRIQNVIKIYGATAGHRNSYRYNFEAMSEVSVTNCDEHIYKRSATWVSRLVASPSDSAKNVTRWGSPISLTESKRSHYEEISTS